jgi:hypothetical protein
VFVFDKPRVSELQYSMVLRFMSAHHGESEVVMNVFSDGHAKALILRSSGSSAWNAANDYIQKNGEANLEEIAKHVKIARQPIALTERQSLIWHSALLDAIAQSALQLKEKFIGLKDKRETSIFLDGSTYELWFEQGGTQIHYVVMDEEVDDSHPSGNSPLAKWMNDVRRHALQHVEK